MKNLKLLLLSLITPLLCGVSFATNNYDNLEDYIIATGVLQESSSYQLFYNYNDTTSKFYCYSLSGVNGKTDFYTTFNNNTPGSSASYLIKSSSATPDNTINCGWGNKTKLWIRTVTATPNVSYKIYDFGAFLSATNNNGGGSSCDYSEYESTINTLSGSLATCQNSLSQCQASNCDTQLSQCLEDKSTLQSSNSSLSGSLSSCLEDKTSLQNYNNSLSSQLNECLMGSGENLSGSSCFDYSMFRSDNDSMFSLPITNNLILPVGYKGKLDEDRVLSISAINTIENAYQFSEEDRTMTVNVLSYIMLFLLATGFIIALLKIFKKLFSR